jgi:hypothetical protein
VCLAACNTRSRASEFCAAAPVMPSTRSGLKHTDQTSRFLTTVMYPYDRKLFQSAKFPTASDTWYAEIRWNRQVCSHHKVP